MSSLHISWSFSSFWAATAKSNMDQMPAWYCNCKTWNALLQIVPNFLFWFLNAVAVTTSKPLTSRDFVIDGKLKKLNTHLRSKKKINVEITASLACFFLLCKIFLKMVKLLTIIVSHHRCDLCFMRPRGNHQSFNQNRLFTCFVASAAPLLSSSTQIGFVFQRWGWGASGLKFLRELCQNRRCDLQFSS